MKLAYWMYAGPAHIGTLRVASSFKNVHAIMHAPLGDDYFNVMRSMLERERDFTPVTASIVDRHVLARGSQEKVVENITRKHKEESPDLVLLTPTCTSSILQEDLHNFVERSTLALTSASFGQSKQIEPSPPAVTAFEGVNSLNSSRVMTLPSDLTTEGGLVKQAQSADSSPLLRGPEGSSGLQQPDVILADVNHYRVNELQAADRTLEQIVRFYLEKAKKQNLLDTTKTETPSVNIIGIFTLGFHNQHDCRELKRLFNDLGVTINEIIPEGGSVLNLKNLPKAWFNFVPYREVGLMTAVYLKEVYNMPYISTTPMGLVDTSSCIREIGTIIEKIMKVRNTPVGGISAPVGGTRGLPDKKREGSTARNSFENPTVLSNLTEFRSPSPNGALTGSGYSTAVNTTIYTRGNNKEPVTLTSSGTPSHSVPLGQGQKRSGKKGEISLIQNTVDFNGPFLTLYERYIDEQTRFISQAAWFARSIDCQNLTGKKAVVFGDATHAAAMTKILAREMGIRVSCAGTYCKHDADWFREQVSGFCDQILITDDHTQVGDMIALLEPAAIFGTQMERHVGKRLDIPCGVISAPVHIQNFPLGYRPFLGYEGANQIADLVYNSFSLGMEDHLLQIFGGHDTSRELAENSSKTVQAETNGNNGNRKDEGYPLRGSPTAHSDGYPRSTQVLSSSRVDSFKKEQQNESQNLNWSTDGLIELNKVPGFVRGKVKRNTEKYAIENQINVITVEVMYAAKEAMAA